ncbi:MAG: hypothetical protein EGP77_00175 [Lachnospiraceae bacterium]|nr:hypothetical protein [Lachnospiraceae bacterium]OLA59932.1 MAG: hypothetical protein BHW48_08790 [Roseburia sp. CAG:10041_57]
MVSSSQDLLELEFTFPTDHLFLYMNSMRHLFLYSFTALKSWHSKKDSKHLLSFLEKVFLSYGV